ncbi:ATP-binding cassette domain-containing protein [Streptomyces sp. MS06]|uniref:ATP-binding cassette domain-containing protein n=1 Tax=Streptomyces sp. MS06 TaxID=3385974 RepID=UPI0039A0EDB1
MIQAFGLTSTSRKDLPPAVDDVSFTAPAARVTTLLGSPGAGKSTAFRLMLGLQRGRGLAHFRGRPLHRIAHPAREVGVVLGDVPGHPARSVRGHLRMLCAAVGVPVRRADEILDAVDLAGLREERLGTLSHGMDRRLGLACALLADPHTLVLDEPARGLSAAESRWLYGMLRTHAARGGTVLLSVEDPREAAREADRVVTLARGRLVADQEVADFARTRLRPRVAVRSPQAARLAAVLAREARAARCSVEVVPESGNRLSVYGSTCADVGETAFRNRILVHRLADEVGDMGPGAPDHRPPALCGAAEALTVEAGPPPSGAPEDPGGQGAETPREELQDTGGAPAEPTRPHAGREDEEPARGAHDAGRVAAPPVGHGAQAAAAGATGPSPAPATGDGSAHPAPVTPVRDACGSTADFDGHASGSRSRRSHGQRALGSGAVPSALPPISVRPAPGPLRPLRYELRRAAGVGTGFLTSAVVLLLSAVTAVVLAHLGHTSQGRLLAAWPREVPLPPAALGAGLLGAWAFGDEFRHPALATDRGTVPRRLGLLAAKLLVSAFTALVLALLAVGCDAEVLHLVYGGEVSRIPVQWPATAAAWIGLVIGCAWAGALAAGVFRSTTAGLAAVIAVPILVVPLVHKGLEGVDVRTAAGLPVRVREMFLGFWPFGGERWLTGVARLVVQPVGGALTLSLTALLCTYLLTTLRGRVR